MKTKDSCLRATRLKYNRWSKVSSKSNETPNEMSTHLEQKVEHASKSANNSGTIARGMLPLIISWAILRYRKCRAAY